MLKFFPKIRRVYPNNLWYAQQMDLGLGYNDENCNHCIFKQFWSQTFTQEDCIDKYKCDNRQHPWCVLHSRHQMEINSRPLPDHEDVDYYSMTQVLRQVKVKGWPMYLRLVSCADTTPQCNSYCWYHPERMQKHQTVPTCAHAHGCSRSGSFFDLLVPAWEPMASQFFRELNSMQP